MPSIDGIVGASKPQESPPALTEAERHALLMEKLDLVGLETWPEEEAAQARSLLKEYHDLFSLERHCTVPFTVQPFAYTSCTSRLRAPQGSHRMGDQWHQL